MSTREMLPFIERLETKHMTTIAAGRKLWAALSVTIFLTVLRARQSITST